MTFIASMDETGFSQFAAVENLARRANVSLEKTSEAIGILEGSDEHSSDPENDGRRIERVPGGWMVLNAVKYRDIVTREDAKQKTRLRVARHREKRLQSGKTANVELTSTGSSGAPKKKSPLLIGNTI